MIENLESVSLVLEMAVESHTPSPRVLLCNAGAGAAAGVIGMSVVIGVFFFFLNLLNGF